MANLPAALIIARPIRTIRFAWSLPVLTPIDCDTASFSAVEEPFFSILTATSAAPRKVRGGPRRHPVQRCHSSTAPARQNDECIGRASEWWTSVSRIQSTLGRDYRRSRLGLAAVRRCVPLRYCSVVPDSNTIISNNNKKFNTHMSFPRTQYMYVIRQ